MDTTTTKTDRRTTTTAAVTLSDDPYYYIEAGTTCGDAGACVIDNVADCDLAAEFFDDVADKQATSAAKTNQPYGCFYRVAKVRLRFNTLVTSSSGPAADEVLLCKNCDFVATTTASRSSSGSCCGSSVRGSRRARKPDGQKLDTGHVETPLFVTAPAEPHVRISNTHLLRVACVQRRTNTKHDGTVVDWTPTCLLYTSPSPRDRG